MHHDLDIEPRRARGNVAALAAAALASLAAASPVHGEPAMSAAATPIVYPAKGQSAQLQDKDKFQCYEWARAQSGFDPMAATPEPAATDAHASAPASTSRSTATGFVRGAAMGAAVGELVNHDAGHGAAAGALGGGAIAAMKQRQAAQQQQQQQQQRAAQQQAAHGQQKATFDRAFAACMDGRGYAIR
jgi:hypothetical protein